ncbi:MAG: hypothetical protein IKU98_08100, partial [Bacteroidaceae bacterium]|nr:hypothetical protein [Bacteroidaceae bacterium]
DFNIFNYVASCLDGLNPQLPKEDRTIYPAKTMSDWHNIYLNVIERNAFKLKQSVKTIFKGRTEL